MIKQHESVMFIKLYEISCGYYSIQYSPWQLANAEAFAKAYLFFSSCLGKKNAEAIKCLRILKQHVAKNKVYFCF